MKKSDDDNPRGCYCGLWRKAPELLRQQGHAEGFCGKCLRCGQSGHTRHHPSMPTTGAWCDRCYRLLYWTRFRYSPAFWVFLLGGLWGIYSVLSRS